MIAAAEQAHVEATPVDVQCAKRHPVKGFVKTLACIVCLLFLIPLGYFLCGFLGEVVKELSALI